MVPKHDTPVPTFPIGKQIISTVRAQRHGGNREGLASFTRVLYHTTLDLSRAFCNIFCLRAKISAKMQVAVTRRMRVTGLDSRGSAPLGQPRF